MLMNIFYGAVAMAVAGAICATVAAVAAEHFRREDKLVLADAAAPPTGVSRRQFALRYGMLCMRFSAVFAVVAAAAYAATHFSA
ncbi:hypothetical protein C3941_17195 [Kaistia algarum]|uniref:hypothetical protein n=1 Tax=Kaistia algarum TaxID=2083279 RepID=UPI000CE90913|nr:hypothetical protein [Kaistia algarum]MCX5516301.1 hypothetical protein [Kaistia algarum]PPE78778.1 hypothetical protein C3941_17195 [Kaistia algarum]